MAPGAAPAVSGPHRNSVSVPGYGPPLSGINGSSAISPNMANGSSASSSMASASSASFANQQQQHHQQQQQQQAAQQNNNPAAQPLPAAIQSILQVGHAANVQAAQMLGLPSGPSARANSAYATPILTKLDRETEACWVQAGRTAESMGNWSRALASYETALRHSPHNVDALTQTAGIFRQQERFVEAIDYFTRVVALNDRNGDVWGYLGHCYLMVDDTIKAYACYQQAILHMPDSKGDPKLWYGIGILYDRHNSLNMAEEAFVNVIQHDPNFEKANEIYFRLGIIYKQKRNSEAAMNCFRYILSNPPRPLSEPDIWFQIGQVFDQQQDFRTAKQIYDTLLTTDTNHAKVLRELGGLYARHDGPFFNLDKSCDALTRSLEEDAADPFAWYLLGRSYMAGGHYGKAYEAYQQAVYRDGKNPAFWCSIGVLYYKINQYHDSLDAYSRAIRTNPYLAEVWHNLGALYESCNDQLTDAVDAYQRTLSLDDHNEAVRRRLDQIDIHRARGTPLSPPPKPIDISPLSESWNAANGSASIVGPTGPGTPGSTPTHGLPGPFSADNLAAPSVPSNALPQGGRRSIVGPPPSRGGIEGPPGSSHGLQLGPPPVTNGAASSAAHSRGNSMKDYAAFTLGSNSSHRPGSRGGSNVMIPPRGMELEQPTFRPIPPGSMSSAAMSPASVSVAPLRSSHPMPLKQSPPPRSPTHADRDAMHGHHAVPSDEGERGRPAMGFRDHQSLSNYAGPAYVDRRRTLTPPVSMPGGPPSRPPFQMSMSEYNGTNGLAAAEREKQRQQHEALFRRESIDHGRERDFSPLTTAAGTPGASAAPAMAPIRVPTKEKRPSSAGIAQSQGRRRPQSIIVPPGPSSSASGPSAPGRGNHLSRSSGPALSNPNAPPAHSSPSVSAPASNVNAQQKAEEGHQSTAPQTGAKAVRDIDEDYDQEGEGADSLIALASSGFAAGPQPQPQSQSQASETRSPPVAPSSHQHAQPQPQQQTSEPTPSRKRSLGELTNGPNGSHAGQNGRASPSESEANMMSKRLKIGNHWAVASPHGPHRPGSHNGGGFNQNRSSPAQTTAAPSPAVSRHPSPSPTRHVPAEEPKETQRSAEQQPKNGSPVQQGPSKSPSPARPVQSEQTLAPPSQPASRAASPAAAPSEPAAAAAPAPVSAAEVSQAEAQPAAEAGNQA